MTDHTLDHLPKRTRSVSQPLREGQTWFSSRTILRARHFADLPWSHIMVPLGVSVALVVSAQLLLSGDLAALANLLGGIGLVYSAHRILSKLTLGSGRS